MSAIRSWWNRPVAPPSPATTLGLLAGLVAASIVIDAVVPRDDQLLVAAALLICFGVVLTKVRERAATRRGLTHRRQQPQPSWPQYLVAIAAALVVELTVSLIDPSDGLIAIPFGVYFARLPRPTPP